MPENGKNFHIVIQPAGLQLDAVEGISILEAAILHDVRMPSSCRNGTCRTCMCRLDSGKVGYRIEWPGLSADEKKEGYILPCVAYPESDLHIDVPAAVLMSNSSDQS